MSINSLHTRGFVSVLAAAYLMAFAGSASGQHVRRLEVAAVSFVPVKFDLEGNADRLEKAFHMASGAGAQIAVAPEGALDGYVVNEIIAGKADAAEMRKVAVELGDPIIQRFQKLAIELRMALVFGLAEKIGDDVFNCAVFIDHTGRICGKQHKMQFEAKRRARLRAFHLQLPGLHIGPACRSALRVSAGV